MTAIKVTGRRFDRQVRQARRRIRRDLGPYARVAGVGGRAVRPSLVARFAVLGNSAEFPQLLAAAYVLRACRPLVVAIAHWREALAERRANQNRVADHRRRRLPAYFTGGQVRLDLLIVVGFQIYSPVVAKRRDALPGLCVQGY